jgi:hypothetical protein
MSFKDRAHKQHKTRSRHKLRRRDKEADRCRASMTTTDHIQVVTLTTKGAIGARAQAT